MQYKRESDLVKGFLDAVGDLSPWGQITTICEFTYDSGRTDIVALNGLNRLIAIEAKLKNWRVALHQAYRNRNYAEMTYVLLPKSTALAAVAFREDFRALNVGLCYLEDGLVILEESEVVSPIRPWVAETARQRLRDANI